MHGYMAHNAICAVAPPASGQRGDVAVRSAMSGKGCRQYPGLRENEGVGEHVRTRFHVGPKAAREIAEPFGKRTAPNEENFVSSAGP